MHYLEIISILLIIFYYGFNIWLTFQRNTIQDRVVQYAFQHWYEEKRTITKRYWTGCKSYCRKKWLKVIGYVHPEPFIMLQPIQHNQKLHIEPTIESNSDEEIEPWFMVKEQTEWLVVN